MRFWSLPGHTSYEAARELQLGAVSLRAEDAIPDTVLFLEHEPVITQGRGLQFTGQPRERHMPLPLRLPAGTAFAESERGGDLTWHGPGQLVIYPIFKLDGAHGFAPARDIAGFLRRLESLLIDELAELGLLAKMRENATGVWVGERKVASLGIAVKRWVTFHGAALNCVNDLAPFHLFSPCGFSSEVMTRLGDLVPGFAGDGTGRWRSDLEVRLARRFLRAAGLPEDAVNIDRRPIGGLRTGGFPDRPVR